MSLNFLYRRNAELCTEMVGKTQSVDVRQQWLELAKGWEKKAESEEQAIAAAKYRPALKPIELAIPQIEVAREPEERTAISVSHRPLVEPVKPFKLVFSEVAKVKETDAHSAAPSGHRLPLRPIALRKAVLPEIMNSQEAISFVPEDPASAAVAAHEPIAAPLQPQELNAEPVDESWATLLSEIRGR